MLVAESTSDFRKVSEQSQQVQDQIRELYGQDQEGKLQKEVSRTKLKIFFENPLLKESFDKLKNFMQTVCLILVLRNRN